MKENQRQALAETELTENELDNVIGGGNARLASPQFGIKNQLQFVINNGFEYGGSSPLVNKTPTVKPQK